MDKIKQEFFNLQFIRFLLVGGLAALVNIVSRVGFSWVVDYSISILLSHLVGMVVAFTLNRIFVFKSQSGHSTMRQIYYFSLVNTVALLQTLGVSLAMAHWLLPQLPLGLSLSEQETFAHIIGVSMTAFSSYIGHKYLSFRCETTDSSAKA